MKLLVITSLKEYLPAMSSLLRQAGIETFSVSKTTGIRMGDSANLLDDWFGSLSGDYDSIFLFSFTEDQRSETALTLVEGYNQTHNTGFPVRAFILPVERSDQQSSKMK